MCCSCEYYDELFWMKGQLMVLLLRTLYSRALFCVYEGLIVVPPVLEKRITLKLVQQCNRCLTKLSE